MTEPCSSISAPLPPPQVRVKLEEFQQYIPLVTAMRNPGLRDRHWERLTTAVGFPVKADAGEGGGEIGVMHSTTLAAASMPKSRRA